MDSYNYENLLPGNGTGNSPIATAVWNDFSFDGNDATEHNYPNLCECTALFSGYVYITNIM